MHDLALQEIIKLCRQRQRDGDHPTAPPCSTEILEEAVIQLAWRIKLLISPDEECEAGVLHPEARDAAAGEAGPKS